MQEKWGTTHPIINRTMFSSICVPHSWFTIIWSYLCDLSQHKNTQSAEVCFDVLELSVLVLREKVQLGKHSDGYSVVTSHIFCSAHHLREVQQTQLSSVCALLIAGISSLFFSNCRQVEAKMDFCQIYLLFTFII